MRLRAVSAKYVRAGGLALMLVTATGVDAARAATETVIYAFTGGSDGELPRAGIINVGGVFYGTTFGGGANGLGTAFQLAPPATVGGAWIETVLYSFTGGSDGENPRNQLIDVGGALYGTTQYGGDDGAGTAFALVPPAVAGGSWTETVLHSFPQTSGDGAVPAAGLTNMAGRLYGTTANGGLNNEGTVFRLTIPVGSGGVATEKVLYRFRRLGHDGIDPEAMLLALGGTLYGTTAGGGVYESGTVFALTPAGAAGGAWTETVLHSFRGGTVSDGSDPEAGLLDIKGSLYGTTKYGGNGCGTVFEITPPAIAGRAWTETVLYTFPPVNQGACLPEAGLTSVGSALYGTTTVSNANGYGTVFKLTPPGAEGGAWTAQVAHRFQGGSDGATPQAGLTNVGGSLYGTTAFGGVNGGGTVFEITP